MAKIKYFNSGADVFVEAWVFAMDVLKDMLILTIPSVIMLTIICILPFMFGLTILEIVGAI